jgi:hypothetical protein
MRRAILWLSVVVAIVMVTATASWTPRATLRFSDARQSPASRAYIGYHYAGSLISPVHSVTYESDPLVIVRAGADGQVTVPGRFHLRPVFPLSTPPGLVVDYVYVPQQHNAFGPVGEFTESRDGVFAVNADRTAVTVFDVSADPERWETALRVLLQFAREALESPAGLTSGRELAAHVKREYAALQERHGHSRRLPPAVPAWLSPAERARWQASVDAHLAREPLWGPYLERMWRDHLDALARLERARGAPSPPSES